MLLSSEQRKSCSLCRCASPEAPLTLLPGLRIGLHTPLGSSPCALFAPAPRKQAAGRALTGEAARKMMLSNTVQVRESAQRQEPLSAICMGCHV